MQRAVGRGNRGDVPTERTAFFFKQWGGMNKKAAGRYYPRRDAHDELPALSMS